MLSFRQASHAPPGDDVADHVFVVEHRTHCGHGPLAMVIRRHSPENTALSRVTWVALPALGLGACIQIADLGPERRRATPPMTSAGGGGHGGRGGAPSTGGTGGTGGCEDPGRVTWAQTFGGNGDQFATGDIASDQAGGVWITGKLNGSFTMGGHALLAAGLDDFFLAHLDADGDVVWAQRFGDTQDQFIGPTVAAMPDGGVLFARQLSGGADFGDGLVSGDIGDGFVVRYAADGTHLWTQIFGGPGEQNVWDVTVDPSTGDIIAVGTLRDTLTVDMETLVPDGPSDVFVARLDAADGSVKALHGIGGPSWDYLNAVAVDAAGSIYIGGHSESAFSLGAAFDAEADGYAFIAKLNPDGTPVWGRQFNGPGKQVVSYLALDGASQLVANIGLDGTSDFGGGPMTLTSGSVVLQVATSDGTPIRSKGILGLTSTRGLVVDDQGSVYLTGPYRRELDLGDGVTVPHSGGQDGLLAKLDGQLKAQWALPVQSPELDNTAGVALTPTGDVLLHAYFSQTISLPTCDPPFASVESADLVVMKLAQ